MISSRGFAPLALIIIIGLIILGGAGYYITKQTTTEQPTQLNENSASQIPITITGIFQGYDSAFTIANEKYLVGYVATGKDSYFVDLRPLIGYELTGVSAKLDIKAGDTVTITGKRSSDGSIEVVSLVKIEESPQENQKTYSTHPLIKAYLQGPSEIAVNTEWKGIVMIPQDIIGIAGAPDVNWGDGKSDPEFGGSPWSYDTNGNAAITHIYIKPGNYSVTIYINGGAGVGFEKGTVVINKTITVR